MTTAVNIPILLSISLFAETACVPFCSIKCFTHSCLPLWVFHTNVVAAVLEQRLKNEEEQEGDLEFLQVVSQVLLVVLKIYNHGVESTSYPHPIL